MSFTALLGTPYSMLGQIKLGDNITANACSVIDIQSHAVCVIDRLTSFDKVIPLLGLTDDSQGQPAMLHALLQYAAKHSPRNECLNPCDDVLDRLSEAGINPHALGYIRNYMHSARDAYAQRVQI